MLDEVKLYADARSAYVYRVKIALNMKGIKYENFEEDLSNKSVDLLKYNPVHKKVPVLVHNGNPISESLVIVEYIDDVWKGVPILPLDPYEKAVARFWAKFIDDKIIPALQALVIGNGEEQSVVNVCDQLQILENELKVKGTKFFGGDIFNLVDVVGGPIVFTIGIVEEAIELNKFFTKDKFPRLTEWLDNFVNCQVVKGIIPPRVDLVEALKKLFLERRS